MEREIAIQIRNLKKVYKLGQIGSGSLQGDLQSWWAKVRGKEDPNAKIGAGKRSNGKTFLALDGIDLTIYKGEAVGIIGGNGAGKSTTLKILSRITAPTQGQVDIYGRIASMLEVGTGFNGELTGRENIYMNGAILGMTKAEVDEKIEQIIDFSECREFIDTPVKRYSSGMYVKLAFAVVAHLDSEIMLMDEVLAVGDVKFQQKCLNKMSEAVQTEGRTVLYVSHNMNTIRQLCQRCVVLKEGKIIYDGDVDTGIALYLEDSLPKQALVNDYTDLKRPNYISENREVDITRCTLMDTETSQYKEGEKLKFCVEWKANKPIEKLGFCLSIKRSDDTPVGTTFTKEPCEGNAGKATLVADVDSLVRGTYKAELVAYEQSEFDRKRILDLVTPAFTFSKETQDGLDWNGGRWGYIKFEDLKQGE